MERLTERISEYIQCNNNECRLSYCDRECEHYKRMINKLAEYEDAEEQGLLLRLPCEFGSSLYWIAEGYVRKVWFKGIRCDKGYKPQIIARYMDGLSFKEVPITTLDNIGETVFLTREEAEQALAEMKGE